MAILRSLIVSLVARTDNFDQGMRRSERSLRNFSTATTQVQGRIRGLASELLKFQAIQAGMNTALGAARSLIQQGLNLERMQQGLTQVTGSTAAAAQALARLQQVARETGFSVTTLERGFTALQAASRGTSLSFEDTTRIFEQFVRAARATGVAEDQLGNVFEEVTELLNQQTISLSDLTPLMKQFPGIVDALARSLGKSRPELEQMSKDGQLLTSEVIPLLADALSKLSQQNVTPLTDAVGRLKTAWDAFGQSLAAFTSGPLTWVLNKLTEVINFLKSNDSWWKKLGDILMWRPGWVEPPPTPTQPPTAPTPPAAPTAPAAPATPQPSVRERVIQSLLKDAETTARQMDALQESALKRMQQTPLRSAEILQEWQDQQEALQKTLETIHERLRENLRLLKEEAEKTQGQAAQTAQAISPQRAKVREMLARIAPEYGLDPRLVEAMVRVESNFDPRAVSNAGAQGLMQLMPPTAKALGVTDPFDIEQNLRGGMKYLAQLLKEFNGDMAQALSAYHSGPGTVKALKGDLSRLGPAGRAYAPAVLAEQASIQAGGGAAATDATIAAATTELAAIEARIEQVRQKTTEMSQKAAEFLAIGDRIAAEDRYIDLLIETQNQVNALTMSEEQLALTSLERMQRQAQVQRDLQAAMRKSPEAATEVVRAELEANLAQLRQSEMLDTLDELRRNQQRSVDDLVGSLEDQVRVLTMTNRQYLEYQLHLKNASDAEVTHAQALQAKLERLEMAREAADLVTDSLIDMAVTGELNLKNLQETFSRMALQMLADAIKLRESLTKLLAKGLELAVNALPSGAGAGAGAGATVGDVGGIGSLPFGGGLQHGGPVIPGRFYTVGERGPELLVAGSSGTVVPNAGRPVVINMHVSTPDADSFRRSGPQISAQMVTAAQRARRVM